MEFGIVILPPAKFSRCSMAVKGKASACFLLFFFGHAPLTAIPQLADWRLKGKYGEV